jgi:hypothetical protein
MSTQFAHLIAHFNGETVFVDTPNAGKTATARAAANAIGARYVKVSPDNPLWAAGIPLVSVVDSGRQPPFEVGVLAWTDVSIVFEIEDGSCDATSTSAIDARVVASLSQVGTYWTDGAAHYWAIKHEYLDLFAKILREELGEPLANVEPSTHAHKVLTNTLSAVGLKEFECE